MTGVNARTGRPRRGRVMFVGVESFAARWQQALAQPPRVVPGMFDALGALASGGSAQEPIAAVIVRANLCQPPHHHAIEALRRLDPAVRIVGLKSMADEPLQGSSTAPAGPDAWLSAEAAQDEFRRAIDDDGLFAAESPGVSMPDSPSAGAPRPSVIELDDAERLAKAPATRADDPTQPSISPQPSHTSQAAVDLPASRTPPIPQPVSQSPSQPDLKSPQPTEFSTSHSALEQNLTSAVSPSVPGSTPALATRSTETEVGDTDLIVAILHDPRGVQSLALEIIRRYSGWRDVHIVSGGEHESTPRGEPIVCEGEHFGMLFAAEGESESLRSWADWLARWLHLESTVRRLRHQAHCDELTGAWNRRFFESFLSDTLSRARSDRRAITVMVFDIDDFKQYNDRFGHEAGDEVLREIVRVLQSIIRQGDIVCRIGGDEFVVVFADPEAPRAAGSRHPESAEVIAQRFQQAVCSMRFPKLGLEAAGSLSISAGLATFPWDGQDAPTLLHRADQRALQSKRNGKNMITIGRSASDAPRM